jgi:hypothetical protein
LRQGIAQRFVEEDEGLDGESGSADEEADRKP